MKQPEKISFGEMREMGVRGVVICCTEHHCSHTVEVADAGRWADEVRLSDIEPRFVCRACGSRSAIVRPDFGTIGTRAPVDKPPSRS
jgi:hypothetical protein